MVVRGVAVVGLVIGCQSSVHEASPVRRSDPPCTPIAHDAAETRRGAPLFEAYRVLGASADGTRIALMLTHMGPGSGQPVGGVHVLEAGTAHDVVVKNYFEVQGTPEDLPKVERGITEQLAPDVAAAGVQIGAHIPTHVAWCSDAAGTIYTGAGAFELRVTHTPCAGKPAEQTAGWQLCSKDGSHCIAGASDCIDGSVSVHDLVRAGGTDWVILELVMRPFVDQEFHLFQASGGALATPASRYDTRIVQVTVDGSRSKVVVGLGAADGITRDWKAQLVASGAGEMPAGGELTIDEVGEHRAVLSVRATDVSATMVRLWRP